MHCYGHPPDPLNLAVADEIMSITCTSDALETVREIAKHCFAETVQEVICDTRKLQIALGER